ncbi:MAG: flavin reductase family protein [Spongiibacteraceae bacterium]
MKNTIIDIQQFRNALGNFATGVCIVTVAPEAGVPIGMTINSFSSVSLEPPLVMWSIQCNSECFAVFESAERFAINVLSAEQQDLSREYSRKGQHQLKAEHFYCGRSGAPLLHNALTVFECRSWARYPGGDHLILVGEVLQFSAQPAAPALGFFKGAYTEIR